MKHVLWTVFGLMAGAALGLVLPVAMVMFIVWHEGERANGIGTPFAILTILTVPAGAILGAYAGVRRAQTGGWKGVLSTSATPDSLNLAKVAALRHRFSAFADEVSRMSRDDSQIAKQDYLRNITDDYESATLNWQLLGCWIAIGLLMPVLWVVPAAIALKHWLVRRQMRGHIRHVMETWSPERVQHASR